MRLIGSILCNIRTLLLVTAAAGTMCFVLLKIQNISIVSVQSNSMHPQFNRGDGLLVQQNYKNIEPGMVITYRSQYDQAVLVSHRVIATNQNSYVTKGDSLKLADPPINKSQIVGKDIAVLPEFGRIVSIAQNKLAIIGLVYIPATAMLISEYGRFASTRPKIYKLANV